MSILDRFRTKQDEARLKTAKPAAKKEPAKAKATAAVPKETKAEKAAVKQEPIAHKAVPTAMTAHRILLRQLVTEKAAQLETKHQYVFAVATDANKPAIIHAIHELYGVKPLRVRIIRQDGKYVRFGRQYGKQKNWKKAIVVLPKEKTLPSSRGEKV